MTRMDPERAALRRRAANGTLEVEHLLALAVQRDPAAATFIQELATEFAWPRENKINGELVAPLGRWAEVVCAYLAGGCQALIAYARQPEQDAARFAIGVLEELKNPQSVSALAALAADFRKAPPRLSDSLDLADAINSNLSFKGAPKVSNEDTTVLRDFLHELLHTNLTAAESARVVCALRGVGDERSIRIVSELPPFADQWAGLEAIVCKAIRKRL